MPLQIPVTQTGLEASIEAAAKKAGRNLKIDLGSNAKSINSLSQPLGRITGQADEFTKSMEAANARVFAFGASVGIISSVTQAFSSLVKNTIAVEKSLVEINTVLGASSDSLQKFGNKLFDVAKTTGQTFDVVAKGALELARQGLSTEETLKRINDALILSRLSGLDAQQSVEGLTAAFNSFKETGITTSEILNKLVVVSQKYSVSEKDLIEGLKRSASVADQAGVSFDELVGIITTVQERTARGGAVIGNAFKTIFARIQDTGALQDLANLGVQITDLEGKVLPATKILQNLAGVFNNLSQLEQADIAKKLGGVYQLSNLLAAVKDLSSEQSKYNDIVKLSAGATNEAYQKNAALNETLAALINKVSLSAQQLGATLGKIGVTDNLKQLLDFFNRVLEGIQNILSEESALGKVFQGIAKGIGGVLAGPGLVLFGAIIAKLSKDLISFGFESLKSFFKIGEAAKEINTLQGTIASTLLRNKDIQAQILALEGNRVAQAKFFTTALNEQYSTMQKMQGIASSIAPAVYGGTRGGRGGASRNAAGGYMPAVSKESRDISRGVGGAKAGDKPVVIPNFAFGGGKKGTMVAHTGEYIVPNFAAGGSAIFNRDMVRSMGLPAGAKKISAAGGFIPNFNALQQFKALWGNDIDVSSATFKRDWSQYKKINNIDPSLKPSIGTSQEIVQGFKNWRDSGGRSLARRQARESAVKISEKGQSQYALLYPGSEPKTGFVSTAGGQQVKIGSIVTQPSDFLYTELRKSFINTAKQYVKNIGIQPDIINDEKFLNVANQSFNEGVLQGAVGNIFEMALQASTGSPPTSSIANFDIAGKNKVSSFANSFAKGTKNSYIKNVLQGIEALDFKNAFHADNINTFDTKIKNHTASIASKLNQANLVKKVGASAAGYIPNFTKYIYDSDRIPADKGATLKAILASSAKKNLIIGPAGSGKSTLAGKLGKFLTGASDVANASEIDILSGAARAKGGGLSKNLEALIAAVNASGGKVSYLYAKNLDILSRRIGRISASDGDLRSKKQLIGTRYAPLNQFDFMGAVKSRSRNFNMVSGAGGFIPNFADPLKEAIGREISAGVPASQIYVDQNSSLKNSMNPMGLMVANRRDEPAGGMQGINRARREGANPMMYGAANGFIPNYADNVDISEYVGKTRSTALLDESRKYGAELAKLTSEISQLTKQYSNLKNKNTKKAVTLDAEIQALTENKNTLKQQSDATRKAIVEQSKGILGTGRTISGKEAKVSPANEPSRDLLGKIFALQAGLSFLTNATSDASNGFLKVGNALADAVSSATSVAFAFQGLSSFAKEGSKASAVLGKIGIYGAIAAGTFELFKQFSTYLDSTNPAINKASESMYRVSDAASKAAINLSNLNPAQQEQIKQQRKALVSGARRDIETQVIRRDVSGQIIGSGFEKRTVQFEGVSDKLQTSYENLADQALGVGISYNKMWNQLNEAAKSGSAITAREVEKISLELELLIKNISKLNPKSIIEEFKLTPEGGLGQEIVSKTPEQFVNFINESRKKGATGGLKPIQDFLFKGGMEGDIPRMETLLKLYAELQDYQKEEGKQEKVRVETASLALLQQQLENRIAYKNALFEATSAEEYSLELQKEMLSVGEQERTAAGYRLKALQDAKKLTLEQEKATLDVLKNSDLINKKLKGAGIGEQIDPAKFEQLAGYSEKISDLIKQQGGYTDIVEKKTEELVGQLGLGAKQQQIILETIKETNGEISKRLALENKINALNNLRAAKIEASKFVNEKQTTAITNEYDQQLKLNELKKRGYDIDLETFKIQSERKKIGGSAGSSFAIDRKIKEQEQLTLKVKFDLDQQDLLIQVRKTLAEAALSAGLNPQEVKSLNLNQVTTPEQAKEKAKEIAKIEGEIQIKKLLTAQADFEKSAAASDYFKNQVVFAADEFTKRITSIIPGDLQGKTPGALVGPEEVSKYVGQGNIPVDGGMLSPTIVEADEDFKKKTKDETDAQIAAIRAGIAQGSALGDTIANMFAEGPLAAEEYKNKLAELDNAFALSGASLTTFDNLVRGVFTNLSENIAQNNFAMLTATDSQSIIGNAVEARRNAILAQGPSDKGTIVAAADATAIYEKELEIKRAITAEDKINGEFELQKLKEILPLRMQLLEADTNPEREAIIDRIIAKEKQRLPVLDRIKAAMTSTPEQRTAELEDSLVNASVQFRDNLIDGISKAIEEGGSLGDVLRSAALDFARSMTQAGLKNVAGQIGGLFGFAKGGLVPSMASGGMINGGSGSKDDVPAMLMGGEYVLKKTAVQKYGSDFLDAINNGRLGGYAKGGKVDELPDQTGAGGFFVPGLNGYGSIVGKENLLGFATQSYTSGAGDVIRSGDNFASVNLEAESYRLTNFARGNDRLFQSVQSAKGEAFDLYGQQIQQEIDYQKQLEEYEKQKKAEKKALRNQLIMMAVTAAAGPILGAAGAGFKAAFGAAQGTGQGILSSIGSGVKGIFTGGTVGGVNVGGLGNMFKGIGQGLTGNFAEASNYFKLSQIGNIDQLSQSYAKGNPNFTGFLDRAGFEYAPRASVINEGLGANAGLGGGGVFGWIQNLGKMFGGSGGSNIDSNQFSATGEDIQPSLWERLTGKRKTIDPYQLMSEDEMADLRKDPVLGYMFQKAQDPRAWRRATGGTIPPTTGIDTVPAMLSGGEFIMNRAASQNIGAGNLQALNAGASSLPTEEKTEELNDKLIAKLDELIEATSGGGDITINVEAGTGKTSEEGGNSENERRVQMARLIKDMVLKVIQDEKRLGGTLRRG